MRLLFLAHAFNCLTQRLYDELTQDGHDVSLEFDIHDRVTEEAVALWRPDVVVAPFLKRRIPDAVWQRHHCLVVHPGIVGDRGPSALDWAILDGESRWGVTVIEATGELDGGDVWASVEFAMREAAKSSVYRHEVTEAAVEAIRLALRRIAEGARPTPAAQWLPAPRGRARPAMRQTDRAIDWQHDDTATVLRKIHASDGTPGVRDEMLGLAVHLHGAHREAVVRVDAPAGSVVAQRDGAILRATRDGAVWITHLRAAEGEAPRPKLPATTVLGERIVGVPAMPLAIDAVVDAPTWREIRYEEHGAVGWLSFEFYNGAMATAQCRALSKAVRAAKSRPTRVLVLAGGPDFWSNGLDLNCIEASVQPADASWQNIEAMNDLVLEILQTPNQLTIAALAGNAGAGGVFLALAADEVVVRDGAVLNPHYRAMGNLYGSEYWTYLLPRRMADARARSMMESRLPVGAARAAALGLVDACLAREPATFRAEAMARAVAWAGDGFVQRLAAKNARRALDEAQKPLAAYRAEELERIKLNFYGFDPSYHVARQHFVAKVPHARTPLWLARHRRPATRGTPSDP
jgi:putative two-component system hydrogenase maturation factor HypX/HoxX